MSDATAKTIPQAIPTEYDGVVYRSKSEAIFGRAMTLAGFQFEYEPEIFETCCPDFDVLIRSKTGGADVELVVEYKPAVPTDTYIRQFKKNVSGFTSPVVIFAGNSYDRDYHIIHVNPEHIDAWRGLVVDGLFGCAVVDKMQEARSFRFDLS